MKQIAATIISNREIVPLHYKMALEAPAIAREIIPGQFIHVRCSDGVGPLLRRPFSLHRKRGAQIEILYKIVGRGTSLLSKKRSGETLDVIGPLGNGFTLNQPTSQPANRQTILIAGGMGVAPLVALAEELVKDKRRRPRVLIGACAKAHILCEKEFKRLGAEVMIATEDGSRGKKGLVTDLLKDLLRATVYSCGPNAMLKEVARIAGENHVPCQVSLEERMACGVGVCLGCPVKVKPGGGYKMVCKDGPVFNAEEVSWE